MIKEVENHGGHSINDQLYDLGLERDQMSNETFMMDFIKQIDSEFDQVILLEYFEEGLVLMAKSLCWALENVGFQNINKYFRTLIQYLLQVTFAALNKRRSQTPISEESREILKQFMKGDHMLYDYFLKKHKEKVKDFGSIKMEREVKKLRNLNEEILRECDSGPSNSFLEKHPEIIGQPWCKLLFAAELDFLNQIRTMNKAYLDSGS